MMDFGYFQCPPYGEHIKTLGFRGSGTEKARTPDLSPVSAVAAALTCSFFFDLPVDLLVVPLQQLLEFLARSVDVHSLTVFDLNKDEVSS